MDLAHLLRHFKVDVAFLTVTIGANPNFAIETFYKVSFSTVRYLSALYRLELKFTVFYGFTLLPNLDAM